SPQLASAESEWSTRPPGEAIGCSGTQHAEGGREPLSAEERVAMGLLPSPGRWVAGRRPSFRCLLICGVALADLNGDRKLDIVTVDGHDGNSGAVSVLLGRGDGSFAPDLVSVTSNHPDGFVPGDFNGDGRLDFAVSDVVDGVGIMFGRGDGSFAAP